MSLEKDIINLQESIGGSGKFPTSGFKFDAETGFAKKREGQNTVPNPRSVGDDVKPAGYEVHNILGKQVNVPYFREPSTVDPETGEEIKGDVTNQFRQGADDPTGRDDADEKGILDIIARIMGIEPDDKSTQDPATRAAAEAEAERKRKNKELDDKGFSPGFHFDTMTHENVRHDQIRNIILEQRGAGAAGKGGLLGGLGKDIAISTGINLAIGALLGLSDDQVQTIFKQPTMTSTRGPEEVLADTKKLKPKTGGELAQEGPRSKKIMKKIKGKLEDRRAKERAARK